MWEEPRGRAKRQRQRHHDRERQARVLVHALRPALVHRALRQRGQRDARRVAGKEYVVDAHRAVGAVRRPALPHLDVRS